MQMLFGRNWQKNHRKDGPLFKIRNDPRVTMFGKFLRRFSFDELPQLWNVFRGDMSMTGLRPHLPDEIEKFTPEFRRVLSIRPGLAGLSQVSGRSDLRFDRRNSSRYLLFGELVILARCKNYSQNNSRRFEGEGAD